MVKQAMKKKFILRVITTKDDLDHISTTGYIKVMRLIPQLFEVEYLESEGRDRAVKNALLTIEKTDKTKVTRHDIIEKNQLTEF
jgi:hypothetical protein